jgi:hypothetical protein
MATEGPTPEIRAALDQMSLWINGERIEYRTTFSPVNLITEFDIREMTTEAGSHTKKHHTAVDSFRPRETHRANISKN